MKELIKKLLFFTPYRIIRARDGNRFQGIDATLLSLKHRGYIPRVVIDGGANVGDFAGLVWRIFGPHCDIHLFEPQPACIPFLEKLASERPNCHLYPFALGSQDDQSLVFNIDPSGITTGAQVAPSKNQAASDMTEASHSVMVKSITLDKVFGSSLSFADRALLKLDLQGWELEALKGAAQILPQIEAVLVEVSYYPIAYEPSIAEMISFFSDFGFSLHDIASLSARQRDNRAYQSDFLFVNRQSNLCQDNSWK